MKQAEIQIGGEYLARVSGVVVRVRVVEVRTAPVRIGGTNQTRYVLERADIHGVRLPKARPASALHKIDEEAIARGAAYLNRKE